MERPEEVFFIGAFFVYHLLMNKRCSLILGMFLCFGVSITVAHANECEEGQLSLEMMTETFIPQDTHMAFISGIINTPNPSYTYDLSFKEVKRGTLRGTLSLYQKSFDDVVPQVITPLKINKSFEFSPKVDGLFIDVVKKFNWGGEYVEFYKVKFGELDYEALATDRGTTLICLKPEIYK